MIIEILVNVYYIIKKIKRFVKELIKIAGKMKF